MRRDEVGEEKHAEQVAAGEDGQGEVRVLGLPEDKDAVEPLLLHRGDAEMHLVQRRGEIFALGQGTDCREWH